jgi:hypothetical protein
MAALLVEADQPQQPEQPGDASLGEKFLEGQKLIERIEEGDLDSASPDFRDAFSRAMTIFHVRPYIMPCCRNSRDLIIMAGCCLPGGRGDGAAAGGDLVE